MIGRRLRGAEHPEEDDHDGQDEPEGDPGTSAGGEPFGEWGAEPIFCHAITSPGGAGVGHRGGR